MTPQGLIVILTFLSLSYAQNNLKLAFQWKQVDFEYPSPEARQRAIDSKEFVQENNLPLGLEVYGDRMFITVPRWKSGVPASLTYIKLTDPSDSPKLRPYPNWEAHKLPLDKDGPAPEVVSPFRIRADRCGRLWVLDTGIANVLGGGTVYSPARLVIYDLNTDTLLRTYPIPKDQVTSETFLANIAVEDNNCNDAYGYLGDLGDPAIIVYSFQQDSSWRYKHHYFNFNPFEAEYTVAGATFIWTDGVFGMGLTAPEADGFSTLYFHPMTGTHEFSVSTRFLHNATLAKDRMNLRGFKVVGTRGPKGQSSVSFLDKKSGVLFYALVNLNSIGCWNSTNPTYTVDNQGVVIKDDVTMVFPNDIKVDANDNLWVLSDRLPKFLYSKLDENDVNFRIFTAPVSEAIKNTPCGSDVAVGPNLSNTPQPSQPSQSFQPSQQGNRVGEAPVAATIFQPISPSNVPQDPNLPKILFKGTPQISKIIQTKDGYEISVGVPIDIQISYK